MNNKFIHYLRTVNKHVAGPLKADARDHLATRAMIAVSGVLSRVIANTESRPARIEQLRTTAQKWQPELSRLLTSDKGAALVRELAQLASAGGEANAAALEECLAQSAALLVTRKDKAAQSLLLEIVDQEFSAAQAVEQKFSELVKDTALMGGETAQIGLDSEQQKKLVTLLQQQCGESEQLAITSVKVNPGGLSKRTIFVELKGNKVLPDHIVLRQDLASSPLGTRVVDEFPLLRVLHEAGVKVPLPLALDAQGVVAGSPLLVVSKTPGSVIGDGINIFDTVGRAGCAIALAREMARYHAIPVEQLPDSVPGRNKTNIETMCADIEVLQKKWDECGTSSVVVDTALAWLFDHLDYAGEQRSLSHGDLRFHNLLVEGSEVVALLDWEIATVSSPGFDLGYAYQDVVKLVDWQTFLDAYADAGGKVPPQETIDFYLIRTEVFIAVNMAKMEDGFLVGAFDNLLAVYGSISFPQYCRYLLAERLRDVLSRQWT